ncbi:MAG: DUF11 domain-containing protein [Chloroflexi bacterium]|nr:DUF11 domain-containing protein [Chloroflexota bacterium]
MGAGAETNSFTNTGAFTPLAGGITFSPGGGAGWTGRLDFDINNNTISNSNTQGININLLKPATAGATIDGFIRNNVISNTNNNFGGSIQVTNGGLVSQVTVEISGNNITGDKGISAIYVIGDQGGTVSTGARTDIRVLNNSVSTPNPLNTNAVHLNSSTTSANTGTIVCWDMQNNTLAGGGFSGTDTRIRQRFSAQVLLPGYAGGSADIAAVQTYITGRGNTGVVTAATQAPGGYFNGACNAPTLVQMKAAYAAVEAMLTEQTEDFALPESEASPTTGDLRDSGLPNADIIYALDVAEPSQPDNDRDDLFAEETPSAPNRAPEATTTVGPFTMPFGEQTTITFQVVIQDPFPAAQNPICNQATISGSNFSNVLSDDPDVAGAANPTCTTVQINADLSITKTDGTATEIPGTAVTYTIVASNAGPNPDPAAVVADTFPATITGVTWTCVGAGGATCTAAGAGNINDTVNLPVGGSVTYTAVGTISAAATGSLVNTATIATSTGISDPVPANNSATDTDTLTPQADVSITKTDGQATDVPGTSIVYTIVASNSGPSNAPAVTVADTFPATLTGVTWTCAGAGGGTCSAAGAGNINDAVNLPTGGSVTYTVNATISASATGTLSNTATATVGGGVTDPTPANNSATDTTTLTPQADVAITKTDGQVTDVPGTSIVYTIVASNAGPSNAPTVTVADTFPATLTGVTWTCVGAGGGTCTAAGAGNINDAVNLPAGGSVTYTVNATIDANASGTLSNTATATVGGGVTDPVPANNSATDTTTLTPQADLSITKTDGSATEVPGTSVTYTIVASNSGPSNDAAATVADTFPATITGVTWTCVGAGGATCTAAGAGNINDTVNLPAGGSVTYTANGTISAAATGTLVNTATVTSSITDPVPANNSATDTDTLTPQADVAITKTDGQATAVPGTAIVYTIVASNSGPSNASGTTIADTFPATLTGVTWTCVGAGGGTCTAAGAGNLNDSANLPVGGSVTYTINATIAANATGTLSNTATATTAGGVTDTNPGNNSATDTTTLNAQADLSITKTDGQTLSVPGAPITYTIVASNAGPSNVTGTTVADTFPVSLTGMTWTCTGAGGGTCAAAGAGNINDTVNLPAGASVTYVVVGTIDVGASGSIINTATVTSGVTDPVPGNNSATDTTTLDAPPVITTFTVTPGTINENGSVTADVTFTDPNTPETHEVVFNWGDGITTTVNLAVGVLTTSANHQYLDDNPSGTASDNYTVTVTVNEPDGGTDSDTATVTVNNVAPVLSAVNATNVNENGSTTLTGTITDPGTLDTFSLVVDWGDGSAPQTFNYAAGTTSFSETHQYLDDNPTGTASDNVTISLTLTDDDTGSDTDGDTITVSNVAPTLSAVAATNVNENGTTTLTGTITDPGTQDTFSLVVNWGDGSAPQTFNYAAGTTNFSETHQYPDDNPTGTPSDNYTISLTLTDDDTGSDTDNTTLTVSNVAPTLSAVAATNVNENGTTTLTGTITDPGTLDTFSLVVNWGDGSAPQTFNYAAGTTSFNETHTYLDDNPTGTASDNVTINLTLTDDDTGSDTDSDTITVSNVAPTLSGVTATANVNEGGVVTLSGTITDPGTLDTFSLVVNWGDGSAPQTFNYAAATTTFSETHTYQDDNPTATPSDNITISLTLTDDDTGSDTDSASITANNVAPTLSAVAATNINENGSTTLSGTIIDPGTLDTFSLVVNWGDGSAPETFNYGAGTTSFSETHTYLDDNPTGTPSDGYTISLSLTDDDTGNDTDSATLTVSNVAPALGSLIISSPINEDDTATLTGTITDPGTLDTFSLVVNWGDGSAPQTFNYVAGTTTFTETHQFLDDNPTVTPSDSYTVSLTLTDDDTGSDTDSATLTVNNVAPALNNVTATAAITETEVVTLTGFIAEVGTQDTFTLTVGWGDGITETFSYPAGTTAFVETHQYLDDGLLRQLLLANFSLALTLSDDDSGVITQTVTVVVNNQAPTLSNVAFPAGVDEGDAAALTGNINEISPLDTFTLAVDWGDGITETFNYAAATTAFTETHTYQDDDPTATPSDTYTVTLILSDDNGGTDVMTTTITVDNVAPVLDSLAVTSVNENDAAALTANLIDPGVLDTFAVVVDWGDGITETFNYGAGTTTISETHTYLDDDPTGTPSDPYSVTVSIADDDTGTGTGAAALIVSNVAPTANAGPDQTVTFATPVNFAGSFTDPGTLDTHELSWDMGDGTIITGTLTPSHLYQTAGTFTVTLTVTDDDTGVGTDTMQVMVGTPTDVTLTSFAGQSRSWMWLLVAAAALPGLLWLARRRLHNE